MPAVKKKPALPLPAKKKEIPSTPKSSIPKKPAKAKKIDLSKSVIDPRSADSFPMIKLIDQRIKESVPA